MPDIASALQKALNDWEPTAPVATPAPSKSHFAVTNNVTRITFEYVRDNPGKTRIEINKELEAKGFNAGSVSSLLGQMLKQGMLRENAHLLYATTNEYTPIKPSKKLKAMQTNPERKKVVLVSKRTGEVVGAAPKVEPTQLPPNVKFNATIPQLLDTLSVVQARELYDELRKIFGG